MFGHPVIAGLLMAGLAGQVLESPRARIDLNGPWQAATTRDAALRPPPEGWQEAPVPGTFQGTALGGSSYTWYRRELTAPQEWEGRRVFLHLGGARYHPHVFLDGELVGEQMEGWTPFQVELKGVQAGSTHRLEVRCQD